MGQTLSEPVIEKVGVPISALLTRKNWPKNIKRPSNRYKRNVLASRLKPFNSSINADQWISVDLG